MLVWHLLWHNTSTGKVTVLNCWKDAYRPLVFRRRKYFHHIFETGTGGRILMWCQSKILSTARLSCACKGTDWCYERAKDFSTSARFSCADGKVDSDDEAGLILSPRFDTQSSQTFIICDAVNRLSDFIRQTHVCCQPNSVCASNLHVNNHSLRKRTGQQRAHTAEVIRSWIQSAQSQSQSTGSCQIITSITNRRLLLSPVLHRFHRWILIVDRGKVVTCVSFSRWCIIEWVVAVENRRKAQTVL